MREIGGSVSYRPWKLWEVEEFVMGKLDSIGEDEYEKPNYIIEVEEYSIDDSDWLEENGFGVGCNIGLNSNGSLDKKMGSVSIGERVKVVYDGQDVMKKGKFAGKDFHKVRVYLMDEAPSDEVESEAAPVDEENADPFAGL